LRRWRSPRTVRRPVHDLQSAIVVLHDGCAAFDPVAAVEIVHAIDHAVRGVVDVSTDDAVGVVPPRFGSDRVFESTDEVDGAFDAVLEIRGQRPIPEPQVPTHPIQGIVEPEGELVAAISEERQPCGGPDDDVELVSMHDDIAPTVGRAVYDALQDLDAAEVHAAEIAQAFIVIAWDEGDPRAVPNLAQKLLDDVVVRLRPMWATAHLPEVYDVADKVDDVSVVVLEELEKRGGLCSARAEVHVRNKQRAVTIARSRLERFDVVCVFHEPEKTRVVFHACDSVGMALSRWSQPLGSAAG
jgi:hypothetical protein